MLADTMKLTTKNTFQTKNGHTKQEVDEQQIRVPHYFPVEADLLTDLAHDFVALWAEAHGIARGTTTVLTGQDSVIFLLEDSFNTVEQTTARRSSGANLLESYFEQLLKVACANMRPEIEARLQREVLWYDVTSNPSTGWIMCLFKLGAFVAEDKRD
jgi:uncharacterized membrane-anchored protein YhcB (DUF1043 family)